MAPNMAPRSDAFGLLLTPLRSPLASDSEPQYATTERQPRDLEREAELRRAMYIEYGNVSLRERCADALARFHENDFYTSCYCTPDAWTLELRLPDGRTFVNAVDPSATTEADLLAVATRLTQRPAADIRLVDREGERLGTADGIALARAAAGKRHRLAVPNGVSLVSSGRIGPDDSLGVALVQMGGGTDDDAAAASEQLDDDDEGVSRTHAHAPHTLGLARTPPPHALATYPRHTLSWCPSLSRLVCLQAQQRLIHSSVCAISLPTCRISLASPST